MRSTSSNPSRSWRQCGASSTANGRPGRSPCGQAPNREAARSSHRLFELVEVELADLRDLRRDHRAAVTLVWVAAVVIAVVLLRRIELLERRHLGHARIVPDFLGFELRDDLPGLGFLLRRVIEDR